MREQIQKTYVTTPAVIERRWWVVDAQGMTLGRLASKVAPILRGKHKPYFTPHPRYRGLCDYHQRRQNSRHWQTFWIRRSIIVIPGYPGGLKSMTLRELMDKFPTRALKFAIKGMLPKGPLGRKNDDQAEGLCGGRALLIRHSSLKSWNCKERLNVSTVLRRHWSPQIGFGSCSPFPRVALAESSSTGKRVWNICRVLVICKSVWLP